MSVFSMLPHESYPTHFARRDKLRELRRYLRKQWRYQVSGSPRRKIIDRLIERIDAMLRGEAV